MPFVPGVKNDLFISYAHVDNERDANGSRWINEFVRGLLVELRQRLGGPAELTLFFDESDLHAHHRLPFLLENVRQSAVFVAICSPSYVSHAWTLAELREFAEKGGDQGRIVVVEKLPIEDHDAYPAEIENHKRTQFWRRNEPESHAPSTLMADRHPTEYRDRLDKFADQVQKLLREMRSPAQAHRPEPPPRSDLDGTINERPSDRRTQHGAESHIDAEHVHFGIGVVAACWAVVALLAALGLNTGGWLVVIFVLIGTSITVGVKLLKARAE